MQQGIMILTQDKISMTYSLVNYAINTLFILNGRKGYMALEYPTVV